VPSRPLPFIGCNIDATFAHDPDASVTTEVFMKVLLLAILVTGCVMPQTRTVLPPEHSHAFVKASRDDTARALVSLFTHRGYPLVDQRALADGSVLLRLKGSRVQITEGGKHWVASSVVGSVFYAVIKDSGANLTSLDLYAKPTLDGHEGCDPRTDCEPLYADARQYREMSGAEEAEVIHGVIAELALEGLAIPPQVSAVQAHDERCLAQRRLILQRAENATWTYTREMILQTAPTCDR
jgi:hypothetical protein